MTRPLRQRHRITTFILAVFIPAIFAVALSVRQPAPTMSSIAGIDTEPRPSSVTELWARADLWEPHRIQTRLLLDRSNPGQLLIELGVKSEIVRADLLLYWVPAEQSVQGRLPSDAVWVGSCDGVSALPLPAAANNRNGKLVLYSLAENELVGISKAFSLSRPGSSPPAYGR